jgi:hypothetical protein
MSAEGAQFDSLMVEFTTHCGNKELLRKNLTYRCRTTTGAWKLRTGKLQPLTDAVTAPKKATGLLGRGNGLSIDTTWLGPPLAEPAGAEPTDLPAAAVFATACPPSCPPSAAVQATRAVERRSRSLRRWRREQQRRRGLLAASGVGQLSSRAPAQAGGTASAGAAAACAAVQPLHPSCACLQAGTLAVGSEAAETVEEPMPLAMPAPAAARGAGASAAAVLAPAPPTALASCCWRRQYRLWPGARPSPRPSLLPRRLLRPPRRLLRPCSHRLRRLLRRAAAAPPPPAASAPPPPVPPAACTLATPACKHHSTCLRRRAAGVSVGCGHRRQHQRR